MVLTAQAPEFVPPSAVRISRPMSSSSSSTVSFTVDRSANIKASISPASPPPPPPAAAAASGTAFGTCPYLSSLSANSPPFYPTNAWNGQVAVQFQGAEEAYCWIPGYPDVWPVFYEENDSAPSEIYGASVSAPGQFLPYPRAAMEALGSAAADSSHHSDPEIDSPCYKGKCASQQSPFRTEETKSAPQGRLNDLVQGGSPVSMAEYAHLIDDTLGCIRQRLLSYGQSKDGNPLKAVAQELLQVVNDCPEAFLLKNAKSQKSIIAVGVTKEKEMHTIGSSMNTDHFNTLTSGLSMLKDKAQDLEKLLENNFLQQREKLEALLHENRKIQVETALVLKSCKLAIACLETDVAICKQQGIGVQEATLKHKGRLNGNFSISGSDAGTSDTRTCNWASALFRPNETQPWIDTIRVRIGGPNTEYQD